MHRQLTTVEQLQQRPSFQPPFTTAETLKRSLNSNHMDLENEAPFCGGIKSFRPVFVDSSLLRKRRRLEMGESLFSYQLCGSETSNLNTPSPLPHKALSGLSPNPSAQKAPEPLTKLSLVANLPPRLLTPRLILGGGSHPVS